MINILITEFIDPEALKILSKDFNVIYKKDIWENSDYLKKEINKFEGIIVRNKTNLNQSILEKAENLKYIGRLGVGLDNIDTEYCKKNNIFVQPATGMNADSVAEYVISSSLSLLKKTKLINAKTQNGQWPRTSITTNELKGKILGLIGFGDIAKKVLKLINAFEVTTISFDPFITSQEMEEHNVKKVTFENILSLADIISIHVPLNNETKYLFDDNNSITFSTRENRELSMTEFYNLIYQYENDCLRAALEYNKYYYSDNDIKPEEELLFTLTIVPFSKISSTNINK